MSRHYYGSEPPYGFVVDEQDEQRGVEGFQAFAKDDTFSKPPGILKRAWNSELRTPALLAFAGGVLLINAILLVDDLEEKARQGVTPPIDSVPTAPSTLLPTRDTQPALPEPELEIDFFEIAVANAAMLDLSLEKIEDGHTQHISGEYGGGLFQYGREYYFATARSILDDDTHTEQSLVVRVKIPIGAGNDTLEYVVPVDEFMPAEQNPELVLAKVEDSGSMLQAAIDEGAIFPLIPTQMHSDVGKTVIGQAVHESPFLDERGYVLRRSLRHTDEERWSTNFVTDEVACAADIQIGEIVLNEIGGRLFPEAYGLVTEVETVPDPHHPGSCITQGKMALNSFVEVHTI
jgi:hypothetical protein